MEKSSLNSLKNIIKSKGMKWTEQREIILDIILSQDCHLSADEVYQMVKEKYPNSSIGIATIYRTLNFLEEVELISSIPFGKDGKKYEKTKDTHHDHLICIKCGKIIEFYDERIEQQQEIIAKKNNFKITGHTMQLYGICHECEIN